jgi:hypothetical protein
MTSTVCMNDINIMFYLNFIFTTYICILGLLLRIKPVVWTATTTIYRDKNIVAVEVDMDQSQTNR